MVRQLSVGGLAMVSRTSAERFNGIADQEILFFRKRPFGETSAGLIRYQE